MNADFQAFVEQEAARFGLPVSYPLAIGQVESGLNPSVPDNPSSGAIGPFQILPGPANAGINRGASGGQLHDPKINTDIALSNMQRAYQAGEHAGYSGLGLFDYTASHSGYDSSTGNDSPDYLARLNQVWSGLVGSTTDPGVTATGPGATAVGGGVGTSNFSLTDLPGVKQVEHLADPLQFFTDPIGYLKGYGVKLVIVLAALVVLIGAGWHMASDADLAPRPSTTAKGAALAAFK